MEIVDGRPRKLMFHWFVKNLAEWLWGREWFQQTKKQKNHSRERVSGNRCRFFVPSVALIRVNRGVHAHSSVMGNKGKMAGNSKIFIGIQSHAANSS